MARYLLSVAASLLTIISVHAQTADDIINNYINAIGGKEKIDEIKSIYKESDIEVMGNSATSVTYILNKIGYKMEMDFNGSKIIQCITDKSGWGINPMMGQSSAEALPDDQLKAAQAQLDVTGPLVDYAAKGNTVTLLGKEDVNGASTYKLQVITKDAVTVTIFINAVSYLPNKAVSKATVSGQDVETTTMFSNYQKTDYGFVVPFSQELTLPQGITLTIIDKKVEINKEIDPSVFQKP